MSSPGQIRAMILKSDGGFARMKATRKLVENHGVFGLKGSVYGYEKNKCTKDHPCPRLVTLYAKMGLHRYNLLKGTKFQLKCVEEYIVTTGSGAPSYYITLVAIDDTAGGGGSSSLQTFQIQVSQESRGQFILTCDIARIRGESRDENESMILDIDLPEWPAENPFEKYCLVKSELQDNDDWIRLYLELALAIKEPRGVGVFNLEIVKVATDVGEGINAKNATFYIRYSDLSKAEDSDRIAIVRRSFDEDTGCFILVGQSHQSSDLIPKKRKNVGEESAENKRINTGLGNQISSPPLATREDDEAANQKIVNSDSGVSME
ncbi:hypothetical protein Rs2_21597 [Raphanus sativus]|uniref:UPF0725 protein EMB2204-like n=1 Tax=Raphanus sativus TaxID=3726 RepID=A0A9W3DT00_RAPSA|nr:UPF0725 protein EMB2204-like [Raphanus sativus]KAJ4894803.1 hypothetical protein Rs2_21597 [Raphanus sativus]